MENVVELKEYKELIAALKLLAVENKKAFKDGVQVSDLSMLVKLASEFSVIAEGFKGLDKLDDEFKYLNEEKIKEVFNEIFLLAKAVKEA